METTTPLAHKLADAFTEGVATTYAAAYFHVMEELEASEDTKLMVPIVNTLLARMKKDGTAVYPASTAMMAELETKRSKHFVMAAAITIAANNWPAGHSVKQVPALATVRAMLG